MQVASGCCLVHVRCRQPLSRVLLCRVHVPIPIFIHVRVVCAHARWLSRSACSHLLPRSAPWLLGEQVSDRKSISHLLRGKAFSVVHVRLRRRVMSAFVHLYAIHFYMYAFQCLYSLSVSAYTRFLRCSTWQANRHVIAMQSLVIGKAIARLRRYMILKI